MVHAGLLPSWSVEKAEDLEPSQIIAITANAMDGEAEKWRAAGADGYLSKPTTLDALRAAHGVLSGPDGRTDCIRAELVVSGPGRCH